MPVDFTLDPLAMARALIGATFTMDSVGGIIVETEAYHPNDPASHSFIGPTPRNGVMFGPPGRLYVYRSYGIHWCANVVCGGEGGAVLLRAIEPTAGLEAMRERRGAEDARKLCSGPGKLCQSLAISIAHNGEPLDKPPFALVEPAAPVEVVVGPRIGISKAVAQPWRFGLKGSRFLSKPFPLVQP